MGERKGEARRKIEPVMKEQIQVCWRDPSKRRRPRKIKAWNKKEEAWEALAVRRQ